MSKSALRVFNTLNKKLEKFEPMGRVIKLYTCGPTVYDYAHIGNMRTFLFEDFLKRALVYFGFRVKHVMNITDVGHLTEANQGEDKIERAARQKHLSARQLAVFYTRAFKADMQRLNMVPPLVLCKATAHIREQIALVKKLEARGYTYKTRDGVYFDTSKFARYSALSGKTLSELKEGARVEINREKRNPTDFAIWKFSPQGEERQMEWASPWGVGFPGWHLECSAMSMKYLGPTFDLHCGGIDLIFPHHTNEIAQSEAATGKQFVRFWMHGAFVVIDKKRMGKSEGNILTLTQIEKMGIDPLAYRYLVLNTHYRKELHFSVEALRGAEQAYGRLLASIAAIDAATFGPACSKFEEKFNQAIAADLNLPVALAVAWDLIKSSCSGKEKIRLLRRFDTVLGLDLWQQAQKLRQKEPAVPAHIRALVAEREAARSQKDFIRADKIRQALQARGFLIKDTPEGAIVLRIKK